MKIAAICIVTFWIIALAYSIAPDEPPLCTKGSTAALFTECAQ